jgi:NAD(P)H-hydrate epimerase
MRPVLTPEETAAVDDASVDPVDTLMDRAGRAVALAATRMGAGYGSRVTVLAGHGNNGGDGWVAARHLAGRGAAVTVRPFGSPRAGGAPERALIAARSAGVAVSDQPAPADLVIDAVFGSGFRGSMHSEVVAAVDPGVPVLAVDIPSGVDAATGQVQGPAVSAQRTVALHSLKPGHLLGDGPDLCGEIEVADIGLAGGDPVFMVCDAVDAPRPARHRTAHKWSAGSVLVVGGSPGFTGAPLLAATAAQRFGAGLVTVLTPAGIHRIVSGRAWGVISRGVGSGDRFTASDVAEVLQVGARFDVMVLGPGLGVGVDRFVQDLVGAWDKPLVLDADGLNSLGSPDLLAGRSAPTVITPHAGEFSRLTGAPPTFDAACRLADGAGVVVLLKGGPTFVVGEQRWAVDSGGPELATAGSGDVLAGMVGALSSRGLGAETAGRSAAYWHGIAGGDLATTTAVTAEDLAVHVGRFAW